MCEVSFVISKLSSNFSDNFFVAKVFHVSTEQVV